MTGVASSPDLLVLHGMRVLGGPTLVGLADLFDLDYAAVNEVLLDAQACGWATKLEFFGTTTWALTEAGKREEERRLQTELDETATRQRVSAAHKAFLPLNERHGRACTAWQTRPTPSRRLAVNDHTDLAWDRRVLDELVDIAVGLNLDPPIGRA